jgi:hypothetical protein
MMLRPYRDQDCYIAKSIPHVGEKHPVNELVTLNVVVRVLRPYPGSFTDREHIKRDTRNQVSLAD